jgi:hypothetical protein
MAKEDIFQPEWAKPQNWPARRRAPGYPRRVVLPGTVVLALSLPVLVFGFSTERLLLGWIGLALCVVGQGLIYYFILKRFCCPECGQRIPLKEPPKTGEFIRFHCRSCNVIWLTGLEWGDSGGSGGGGVE